MPFWEILLNDCLDGLPAGQEPEALNFADGVLVLSNLLVCRPVCTDHTSAVQWREASHS